MLSSRSRWQKNLKHHPYALAMPLCHQIVSDGDLVTTQQRINRTLTIYQYKGLVSILGQKTWKLSFCVSLTYCSGACSKETRSLVRTVHVLQTLSPNFQVCDRSWHCGTSAHKLGHRRERRKWNTVSNLTASILCRDTIPSTGWSMDFCFCCRVRTPLSWSPGSLCFSMSKISYQV